MPLAAVLGTVSIFLTLTGCALFETADSYCSGLYDHANADTPKWAEGQFDDYDSCVDWYEESKPPPGT